MYLFFVLLRWRNSMSYKTTLRGTSARYCVRVEHLPSHRHWGLDAGAKENPPLKCTKLDPACATFNIYPSHSASLSSGNDGDRKKNKQPQRHIQHGGRIAPGIGFDFTQQEINQSEILHRTMMSVWVRALILSEIRSKLYFVL